jgi:hypothetical protein
VTLRWKFWKREKRKDSPLPDLQQRASAWLPMMSSRELLGLQRVIGNQAVLELIAVRNRGHFPAEEAANGTWQFPWRRKPHKD